MARRSGGFLATAVAVAAVTAATGLVGASAAAIAATATPVRPGARAEVTDTASVAYQINAAHDGAQQDPQLALPLRKEWVHTFEGNVGYPVIADHRIFVDVEHHGTKKGTSVSALDLDTGAPIWGPVDIGGGHSKFGALTYEGGRVFALNGDATLWALDAATGAVDWSVSLPDQYGLSSAPTASGGVVYVGGEGSQPSLFAIDEVTGHVNWSARIDNGSHSAPAVDATGVYVSYHCGTYAFATNGASRWSTHDGACLGGQGRTVALHDGRAYIRDADNENVIRSESNGASEGGFFAGPIPAISGTTMYSTPGFLYAFDPAGAILWQNADGAYLGAPIVVNGLAIAVDNDGRVHAIDAATGTGKWSARVAKTVPVPDEYNAVTLTGLAEAEGRLAIPAGHKLVVFASKRAARGA